MDINNPLAYPLGPTLQSGINENVETETARPVSVAERIKTIDIIRGVALLGILLMNIPGFGIDWSISDTIRRGLHNTADFYTMGVINVFFEGTMRGLFSMLFGAGMILFTMNKKEKPEGITVAELYYRRLLWLVLFGVINAYVLLWPGDILFFYGLCGMVLFPFRKTAPKWLFILGFIFMSMAALKTTLWFNEERGKRKAYLEAIAIEKSGKKLTAEQQAAKAEWLEIEKRRPDQERVKRNVSKMRSGYGTVFTYLIPNNSGGETWGTYHWAVWDCIGMMLIGMALFKLGFFSNKLSSSRYLMGLVVGYGIGIPIGYFMFTKGGLGSVNLGPYLDQYRVSHWVLYDLKRVFLSLGHASLVLLVFRSGLVPWLMKSLANVGQMAFTNYLMQSIICTLFFYGYGLGYYNHLKFHQLYFVVGAVWVFQLIVSPIWLHYYRFGPFEWLWRSLTYWKWQPMKRNSISPGDGI
jgi:uncharacterized protein